MSRDFRVSLHLLSMSYDPSFCPKIDGFIGRCSEPFKKQLTVTDVNTKQCRLSIKKEYAEKVVKLLLKKGEDVEKGIPVKVYDADGNEYSMTFIYWSKKIYVLKEGWTEFCTNHGLLAQQDFVTLQAFRHLQTGDLCFLITSRREEVFKPVKKRKSPEA